MKTQQINKLAFTKNAMVALNNAQLSEINGGTATVFFPSSIIVITLLDKELASN